MKKSFTLGLSLIMTGAMMASAAAPVKVDGRLKAKARFGVAVQGETAFANSNGLAQKASNRMAKFAPQLVESYDMVGTVTASGYGYLTGTDGSQWYYTQSFETKGEGYNASYSKSIVTLYDSGNKEVGSITVEIPESLKVNYIEPYRTLTKKLFDRDESTTEMAVMVHAVGNADNNYQGHYYTYVYHTTGEKALELDGVGMIFDASKDWNTYQRMIIPRQETATDGTETTYVDVIAPPSYGETELKVEHSFVIDEELVNYSEGAYINCYDINGKPYYVISHYEKPYASSYDGDGYPVATADNKFVVKVYDKSFNRVDSIAVPIEKPSNATYRFAAFGYLSDKDLSDGYFTAEGQHAIVVTFYDLTSASDSYIYEFDVFDGNGTKLNTVCKNAAENEWFYLSPVKGHSEQMAFYQIDDETGQVQIVNMPSCEPALTIPASINGEGITTTLDRYPKGDSYLYAIKRSTADADADNNVIACINWYTPDLTLDHVTKFNLGQNGEYFTPLLNSSTMNPYMFDTDDELEYIYIAKKKRDGSDAIDNVLEIANEDGTVIKSFRGDDNFSLYSPSLVAVTSEKNQLNVVYRNSSTGEYKLDFYELPFSKFTKGGDGTEANPYLISTAGDMMQIKDNTTAAYKIVDDIDMSKANANWSPIKIFTGTLDGDGHCIENLSIESDEYQAGLFKSLSEKSQIKNLTFINPTVTVTTDNNYVGVLAGEALSSKINDVHVTGANITATSESASPMLGGLVGDATFYSDATSCSFSGTINVPGASSVGGIFGTTRTSTNVTACFADGTFTANNTLGGIVGSSSTDCKITDCHANVALTAQNVIGGIVGEDGGRGLVSRCVAQGSITSTQAPRWGGISLGGIAGSLASDWTRSTDIVMTGNVADVAITKPTDAEDDGTIHRIVGRTIVNEDYEEGETPYTEIAIANNYATSKATIDGKTITSDDATSVEGATKADAELTKDFFTGLGFVYGESSTAPWKADASTVIPVLYYENVPMAIIFEDESLLMDVDGLVETKALVYGAKADDIAADDATCTSSDPSVATAQVVKTDGNAVTIRVSALKAGSAVITLSLGNIKAECNVTVASEETGISTVSVNGMNIRQFDGKITADGASSMAAYSVNGQLAARTNGGILNVSNLTKGVYVVIATAPNGSHKAAKVVVK